MATQESCSKHCSSHSELDKRLVDIQISLAELRTLLNNGFVSRTTFHQEIEKINKTFFRLIGIASIVASTIGGFAGFVMKFF